MPGDRTTSNEKELLFLLSSTFPRVCVSGEHTIVVVRFVIKHFLRDLTSV